MGMDAPIGRVISTQGENENRECFAKDPLNTLIWFETQTLSGKFWLQL